MHDPGLRKHFISFHELIAPERLVDAKLRTNELEELFAREDGGGGRTVNVDPGCVNHSKMVLATTKDHAHRVYVGRGIFEEVTLSYRRTEGFIPNPWTYPDYRSPERLAFFGRLREIYCRQIGGEAARP